MAGSFCKDCLNSDYAFQVRAAYFKQQKDNTFSYSLSH